VSAKAARTCEPPISDLIARALHTPGLISFAAGLVDEEMLPAKEVAAATRRVFAKASGRLALQYGTTPGLPALRQALVAHIAKLEGQPAARMGFDADDILLTTGSQQSLYLIAEALLDPGDIVIAANPSYFVYTGTLASIGARVLTVPMDEQGMQVAEVGRLLQKLDAANELSRVKFIYCTSFFQNPTGLTLSLRRRRELLDLARRYSRGHRILVVEDAAYRELQYDGRALPSIKSFDRANQYTVLTQTFSKPFAPGLKLGYTVMPPDLMQQVLRLKGNHDFGSANLSQWLALDLLRSGAYRRQVQKLKKQYTRKRDLLLRAMRDSFPPGIQWTMPQGGLYTWVTMPANVDTGPNGQLFARCLAQGALYVPGEYAYGPDAHGQIDRRHLRLCFGQVRTRDIKEGVARLARAMTAVLGKGEEAGRG
jgi:2-aminoadipate transaminase